MAALRPRIVFFDIDDTLFYKDGGRVPVSAQEALAALQRRGIAAAIATGRSPGSFPPAVRAVIEGCGLQTLVAINGQFCTHGDAVVFADAMPRADIERLLALCAEKDWAYMQALAHEMVVSRDDAVVSGALTPIGPYRVDAQVWRSEPVYQFNVYVDEAGERELHESGIMGDEYQTIRWHPHSVDYLPARASKARGIAAVCAHLGIGMDEVMVFGDGLNDLEMFRAAGFAVAMGNARPELKALADFVTRDVDDDGVWHALKALGVIG